MATPTDSEVDEAELILGIRFPSGYREYITTLGGGILGGCYIRIYTPRAILHGPNNLYEWRRRIAEYWFWDAGAQALLKSEAMESIIIGDTLDGDELIVHPSDPEKIYVLPRNNDAILLIGRGLFEAIDWLCSAGILTEPFTERNFEPTQEIQGA